MGFGFWNEGKYFKIELLLTNIVVPSSSLVTGQVYSIPYAGNTVDVFESL